MSIIIDTSVIVSVILNEKSKSKLIKFTDNKNLIAPKSIKWEVGNALSAMLKRKRIDIESAQKAIEYYNIIPIMYVNVDINKSLEISNLLNIYAYDAYIIECAKSLNLPILSLDEKLINKAKMLNIKTMEI